MIYKTMERGRWWKEWGRVERDDDTIAKEGCGRQERVELIRGRGTIYKKKNQKRRSCMAKRICVVVPFFKRECSWHSPSPICVNILNLECARPVERNLINLDKQ